MKIAAVGNWEFSNGFKSAGAQAYLANSPEEAKKILEGLENVPIVLVGESASAGLEKTIEEFSLSKGVSIVVLQDGIKSADSGAQMVKRSIERATGIAER